MCLALLLSSCYEDDSCNQNTVTGVNALIINNGNSIPEDSVKSFYIMPIGEDSISFINSENVLYTPGIELDLNNDSTIVVFKVKENSTDSFIIDTITLNHKQIDVEMLSIYCGIVPIFELIGGTHTTHILDSITLQDSLINTDVSTPNVTIYY
jgi:hypothetical protein